MCLPKSPTLLLRNSNEMNEDIPKFRLYGLALVSSLLLYWLIGTYMSVAAGFDFIVLVSLAGSILHFGIGSWLFLWTNKLGRILALLFLVSMSALPVLGLFWALTNGDPFSVLPYLLIIGLIVPQVWTHLKFLRQPPIVVTWAKWALTVPPSILISAYLIHFLNMIQTGQISFG